VHGSPDDYVCSLNQRIGAEVKSRREALGLSAYTLAKAAGVTDQTILNLEQGLCPNGPWAATLMRIAVRFGTTFSELVAAAERRR
jgi:transcriptional regulator with XRE-family HTH domain